MSEGVSEQLQDLKNQFDKGVNPSGDELTSDEKVLLAVNIAQQEFISNFYSNSGIKYLNKSLNWPPSYEKTVNKQYPSVSDEPRIVALATYELLESTSGGIFSPTEEAAILVSDVSRFADKLESKKGLFASETGDILFARFANAVVALAGFKSKERRDEIFGDLQKSILKAQETHSSLTVAGTDQIHELVDLFNKTKWNTQSLLEGQLLHLIENLFRSCQGNELRFS
jgi:hypothetical protein